MKKSAGIFLLLALGLSSCEQMDSWLGKGEEEVPGDTAAAQDTSASPEEPDTIALDTTSYAPDTVASDSEQEEENARAQQAEDNTDSDPAGQAKQWRLVLASLDSRERAERYIDRKGISGAQVMYVDRLNTYRVVYRSFANLREAQQEYEQLLARYPDAWLVHF